MRTVILAVLITLSGTICSLGQGKVRGKECWVFRSVLDKRARMVTVALNPNLYCAYDASSGLLYKVWKEGVKFEGPVYNQKHGPQPSAKGNHWFESPTDKNGWMLIVGGKQIPANVQFKGYEWLNDKVTFLVELTANNYKVTVKESPEYEDVKNYKGYEGDRPIIFERKITVEGLPADGVVSMPVSYAGLIKPEDWQTTASLNMTSKTERYHSWGKSWAFSGYVNLTADKPVSLKATLNKETLR